MNSKNELIKENKKEVEIVSTGLSKDRKALIGKSEDASVVVTKKKEKLKKPKKCEYNNENISVVCKNLLSPFIVDMILFSLYRRAASASSTLFKSEI